MNYTVLTEKILTGGEITREEARTLMDLRGEELWNLFAAANEVRGKVRGNKVDLESLINARSGRCPENCTFCSQSLYSSSTIEEYPLVSPDEMVKAAAAAKETGVSHFCIVTSGLGIGSPEELDQICLSIRRIKREVGIGVAAALGIVTEEELWILKRAGLDKYHNNLETSRRFFPSICTTHTYDQKVETLRTAKKVGLAICSGGIIGMGETLDDRIDLAFELKALECDSIAINFLMPIAGTPLEDMKTLSPLEALQVISLFRFVLPNKEVRIAGGRLHALGDLHPFVFYSGADALLIGNYLTQKSGRDPQADLRMIRDLGLTY